MSVNRIFRWLDLPRKGAGFRERVTKKQPMPLETRVARIKVGTRWITAIFRAWQYDHVPECQLCPRGSCCAVGGSCLLQITAYVSDADAPLYLIPSARIDGPG
jgi:hypothetical protein